jgi:hypothetical protein
VPFDASMATIARPGVGPYITPSTTIGFAWMFPMPSREWYVHASRRFLTFSRLICASAE